MYIFLDESGDLGFNFSNHKTSPYFIITLLTCENRNTFNVFKSAIKHTLLRKINKNRKNPLNEIKSTRTTLLIKKYFLAQVQQKPYQNWNLYTIILDKKKIITKTAKIPNENRIYNILSHTILKRIDFNNVKQGISLVVDLCKVPKERKVFNQYLITHLEANLPSGIDLNIYHTPSHNSVGLQAVDLFCGGIARKYMFSDTSWYNCFCSKIKEEILY